MSSSRTGVKVSVFGVLGTLAIMTILMAPAYADPIIKPTSGGTLNISFETSPTTPNPGDQTMLKIGFLNKQNAIQPHIDYKVSVMQGNDQVFGIPVSHVATEGAVSIPMQFQTAGTYSRGSRNIVPAHTSRDCKFHNCCRSISTRVWPTSRNDYCSIHNQCHNNNKENPISHLGRTKAIV